MPVVDALAAEYADEVDFVAPAWKSSLEGAQARADELFLSGKIQWGLDEPEKIFQLYGVPYQPVTVLVAGDQTVVEAWAGVRGAEELRAAIENLIALSG
ncbi:MAG: TlpA family protein disulfide reductase [Acidimicrobiia bacterium]